MLELFRDLFFGPIGPLASAQALLDWRLYAVFLGAVLSAITVHEFGHAWAADRLGDPTPRSEGRVSLNPLRHLDPLGGLLMVVTLFWRLPLGWGRPVRTNPDNFRCGARLGTALVAMAGPAMNLVTALLLAPVARYLIERLREGDTNPVNTWGWLIVAAVMLINLSLFFFNLVPVHPLDGVHVAASALPEHLSKPFRAFMKRYGSYVLLGLVASQTLPKLIAPLVLKLFLFLIGK